MDFFCPNKSLLLLQLLLLVSISNGFFPVTLVHSETASFPFWSHPRHRPPVYPPVYPPAVHPPVHPPVKPPVQPPVSPPVYPPVNPPVKPPVHPPVSPPLRSYIMVDGLVYCESCRYKGKNTIAGATPIQGALVKLECKNTKRKLVQTAKTNKNGYFILVAPKTISSYAYNKCKVTLLSSPLSSCNKPSTLNGGKSGALLKPTKSFQINKVPYTLYSVGPFAFEPTCSRL